MTALLNRCFRFFYECRMLIVMLVGIKCVLFIIAVLAYGFWNGTAPDAWQLFYHWDVRHYLDIAEHGYTLTERDHYFQIVFMPLWPMLIYLINLITGNVLISGMILAQIFSLLGACFLFQTIKRDYSESIAFLSVVLLFLFPTGFFFHLPYTESLFLFFLGGFFYALRSQRFFAAALWGFFLASTRVMGFLMIVPYLVEYFVQYRMHIRRQLFYPLIILAGFGGYLIVNYFVGGNFFYFLDIQKEHWTHKTTSLLLIPKHIYFAFIGLFHWNSFTANDLIVGKIEPFFSLLAALLLVLGYRMLKPSYFWYSLVNIVFIFSQSFWASNTRYLLIIFPLFIVLADLFVNSSHTRGRTHEWSLPLLTVWFTFSVSLMTLSFIRFVFGLLSLV